MYVLLDLVITIDDQIEAVAGSGHHGNKLLTECTHASGEGQKTARTDDQSVLAV